MKKYCFIIIALVFTHYITQAQWFKIKAPQSSLEITDITFFSESIGYISYYNGFRILLLKTTDLGKSWDTLNPDQYIYDMLFLNPDTGIIRFAVNPSDIYLTINKGKSFKKILNIPSGQTGMYSNFYKNKLFISNDSTTSSDDLGKNWEKVNSKSLSGIHFIDQTTGFAIMNDFQWNKYSEILKTKDGGNSWQKIKRLENKNLIKLQMVNADTGYSIFEKTYWQGSDSVFFTSDGGLSWSPVNNGKLSGYSILDIYFPDSKTGYILTGMRIFKTPDGGLKWHEQTTNFECTQKAFLGIDKNVVFTKPGENQNCFYYTLNGGEKSDLIAEKTKTDYRIFPSPASKTLIIFRNNSKPCTGWVKLYNLQGKKVLSEQMRSLEKSLDVSTLPKGIYFVKITDKNGVWVGKFLKE